VTAITHRRNRSTPTTIVGKPPMEDFWLGKATERIFLPLLQMIVPDVVDYDLPMFGCFHNCAFVKIRKEYPIQARRVMHAIWGAGQMAFTKIIVVVDEHVDVHDQDAVLVPALQQRRPETRHGSFMVRRPARHPRPRQRPSAASAASSASTRRARSPARARSAPGRPNSTCRPSRSRTSSPAAGASTACRRLQVKPSWEW
jgi:hypothetical protein